MFHSCILTKQFSLPCPNYWSCYYDM